MRLTAVLLFSVLAAPSVAFAQALDWAAYTPSAFGARSPSACTVVDFWAEWCPECRLYDEHVFSDTDVAQFLNEHCQLWRFDLTDFERIPNQRARRRFAIDSLPVILLRDHNGREQRIERLLTAEAFLWQLQAFLDAGDL